MASSICSRVRAFSSWWITRFRSPRSRLLCSRTYLTASSRVRILRRVSGAERMPRLGSPRTWSLGCITKSARVVIAVTTEHINDGSCRNHHHFDCSHSRVVAGGTAGDAGSSQSRLKVWSGAGHRVRPAKSPRSIHCGVFLSRASISSPGLRCSSSQHRPAQRLPVAVGGTPPGGSGKRSAARSPISRAPSASPCT